MLQQCLHFHARPMLDNSGLTRVCGAAARFLGCRKNQGFDGSAHEHRKIIISNHANIF